MRITCFSDSHWFAPKIEPTDILIFAGDANLSSKQALDNFIAYYKETPAKYKILIGGNHDGIVEVFGKDVCKQIFSSNDIIYLEDEMVEINGIKIYGTPWTVLFNNWHFMKPEYELAKIFEKVPKVDIFVSHGPAYGILDTNLYGKHCGSKSLLNIPKPKYFIHGHIHLMGGKQITKKGVTYINCSVADEQYNIVNKPITFEI